MCVHTTEPKHFHAALSIEQRSVDIRNHLETGLGINTPSTNDKDMNHLMLSKSHSAVQKGIHNIITMESSKLSKKKNREGSLREMLAAPPQTKQ